MKNSKTLLTLLATTLIGSAAYGQVEVTITGSTAFRSITIDRSAAIFDAPSLAGVTNGAASLGQITFSGTMSNKVASLGATPIKIRLSFSGSASGMLSVKNQSPVVTSESPGVNVNKVPDLALSDVYPGAATPPIAESAFNRSVLGVVPFLYVKNNALTGINNITRDQATLLMTASGVINGVPGMPASYLGGTSPDPIYMIGRDSGSGTRISVERDIGFVGSPTLWATNSAGGYVLTNGFSSGALERAVIKSKPDAIGYLGRGDYATIALNATAISFDGVAFSPANVGNGSYSLWGYEHIVNRVGGLSANQILVRNALISAITNPAYQTGTPLYNDNFVSLSEMHVERGADGGTITSLDF
jgi:hypothetical protein